MTTGWPFRRPGQLGALSSRNQKLLIPKPSAKMHGHQVSPMCNAPPRTYGTHAGIGGTGPRGGEQKPPGLPVSTSSHPMPSPAVPQGESTFLLLPSTRTIVIISLIHSIHPGTPGRGAATFDYFSQTRT